MHRRTLLTCAGVALSSPLAGCAGLDGGVDAVSVTAPTVEQGETATFGIEAPELSGLGISEFPEEFRQRESLELGEATFDPSPETVWQAYPPYWEFSGRDTEGTVAIRTYSDTPPETYRFEFAFRVEGEEEPRHEETTVTVKRASAEE